MLSLVALRNEQVGVDIGPVDIELRVDTRATARFTCGDAGAAAGLLPDRAQVYRVETGWRLDDGEWHADFGANGSR